MEISSNFSTPTTIDITDIPIIDDETSPSSSSDQQIKQQTDESSDDEHLYLKRLQSNQQEIKAPTADDDDEEHEASDVMSLASATIDSPSSLPHRINRKTTTNFKSKSMASSRKSRVATGTMISFSNDNSPVRDSFETRLSVERRIAASVAAGIRRTTGPNKYQCSTRHGCSKHNESERR